MAKLLLVKLGAIGDVIMAIPGAYLMHQAGYTIDWVVSDTVAPILRLYPWIHVLPVEERPLLRSGIGARIRALLSLWRVLSGRGSYDRCITLYYDRRYKLLSLPVRARRKIRLSRENRATMLLPGRHHTDEYARIFLALPDRERPVQLEPVRALGLATPSLLPVVGRPRVVLVPGGARNLLRDDALRRWPLDRYVELGRALIQAGYEVVLCGGPDDHWTAPAFTGMRVTDLTGKLSLVETLSLLNSAVVTVTHDTGPLHMAGITSTAIVALFGPTDPHGRLPQRANCIALWGGEGFACRPCYDGRDFAPCPHNGCLHQVTVGLVLDAVRRLRTALEEGRPLPPRVEVPQPTQLIAPAALVGAHQ